MISVCILSKNAASVIQSALESVKSFPEVILVDTGSTDETLEIATHYPNVKIFKRPFLGFGSLRNEAASLASNDWILALDTDEALSSSLLEELKGLQLEQKTLFSIARQNYYNGKHIKGCGWHPDRVIRLYHRKTTTYSEDKVHESVLTHGLKIQFLQAPMVHVPFRSTGEFLAKMQHYSTLFAAQYKGRRSSSMAKAFCHSLFSFFRSYFFKGGIFLGGEGFIISLYNSNTTFYKYLKLSEENRTL